MDTLFQGSTDALNAGDAAAGKDLMEKGERQLEKLEKALNKEGIQRNYWGCGRHAPKLTANCATLVQRDPCRCSS